MLKNFHFLAKGYLGRKTIKKKVVVFGRDCSHAFGGMFPGCLTPLAPLVDSSVTFKLGHFHSSGPLLLAPPTGILMEFCVKLCRNHLFPGSR